MEDGHSFIRQDPGWKPDAAGASRFSMAEFVKFATMIS
jgi:hypothetical protein